MLQQLRRYDNDWRSHHRRHMDESSLVKQITAITILLVSLIIILTFMP